MGPITLPPLPPPLFLEVINSIGLYWIGPKESPYLWSVNLPPERNNCRDEYAFPSWTNLCPHIAMDLILMRLIFFVVLLNVGAIDHYGEEGNEGRARIVLVLQGYVDVHQHLRAHLKYPSLIDVNLSIIQEEFIRWLHRCRRGPSRPALRPRHPFSVHSPFASLSVFPSRRTMDRHEPPPSSARKPRSYLSLLP